MDFARLWTNAPDKRPHRHPVIQPPTVPDYVPQEPDRQWTFRTGNLPHEDLRPTRNTTATGLSAPEFSPHEDFARSWNNRTGSTAT